MRCFSVHEAKTHLSRLLKRVQAGEEILITSSGKPVARLMAPPRAKNRVLGDMESRGIAVPEKFDALLPEDWSFPRDDTGA